MKNVRRAEDGQEAFQCGDSVLEKRQRLERKRGYLVRDGVRFSLEELLGVIESRGSGLSVRNSYGRMLVEILGEKALRAFAKCIREWVLVDMIFVCDGNILVIFVKSGLTGGGRCPTLKNYDRAANKVIISWTEDCEMQEQIVYVSCGFGAGRKFLNSFMMVRDNGD